MNWKNVVRLIHVDTKSGRLARSGRLGFLENRLLTYLLYGGALALGTAVGVLVGYFYNVFTPSDPQLRTLFIEGLLNLFLSLPTLVLIYSLVFTMMQQIRRSGVKLSVQAPYWLPITWEEHTLASALANLLGFPLISVVFIGSAIIAVSFFTGPVVYAVLTLLAILGSVFIGSAITEIFRTLQVRFIGAVYKSSGRAAVWVRFVGSLLFFILFYIVYFAITSGAGALTFVQSVASAQSAVWFVPFVWLGMTLFSAINGLLLQAIVFLALSLLLLLGLFYGAVALNRRFGLYEPPALTVTRGVYAPRTGFLGRLGFSTAEAALIRKDLKAFTRRRELMYIFILPIVIILVPLMQSLGLYGGQQTTGPLESSLFLVGIVFLMPSAFLSFYLGSIMIGEEGGAIWRIYSSPISAESLVKSKYLFMVFFSTLVIIATGTVGAVIFHPSPRATFIAFVVSFLLMLALSSVSLSIGIRGSDFRELPRPRMIRTEWSLINMIVCFVVAVLVLAPFIPYALTIIGVGLTFDAYQAVAVSTVISVVITLLGYRLALEGARELLARAEM